MPSSASETYVVTGGKPTITKDPQAVLDYSFDWGPWLTPINDTITDATFTVDETLAVVNEGFEDTTATVWLSGGAAPVGGGSLRVTCRITTAGGRTEDRSIFLRIAER